MFNVGNQWKILIQNRKTVRDSASCLIEEKPTAPMTKSDKQATDILYAPSAQLQLYKLLTASFKKLHGVINTNHLLFYIPRSTSNNQVQYSQE